MVKIELYAFLALMLAISSALALPLPEGQKKSILHQRDLGQEISKKGSWEYLSNRDTYDGLEARAPAFQATYWNKIKKAFSRKDRQAGQVHPARDSLMQKAGKFIRKQFTRRPSPTPNHRVSSGSSAYIGRVGQSTVLAANKVGETMGNTILKSRMLH